MVSDYRENRRSDLVNKTKREPPPLRKKMTKGTMYTRDKKMRVQDSCRGGWLLSAVSVLILGDFKSTSFESEQQWYKQQE
jgi:hypothetical protein